MEEGRYLIKVDYAPFSRKVRVRIFIEDNEKPHKEIYVKKFFSRVLMYSVIERKDERESRMHMECRATLYSYNEKESIFDILLS
jgi:hypothetical protein